MSEYLSNKRGVEYEEDNYSRAVTFGRYNTTTVAHISTIEKIANTYEELSVGVIDSDRALRPEGKKEFAEFYDLADEQHKRTTLTLEERKRLLELSIADRSLGSVVIVEIARPEYAVAEFNETFPPEEHQVVFPVPRGGQTAEFDSMRDASLSRILGRTTLFLSVDLTLHTSEIKAQTLNRPDGWSEFMTPSAYEYFRDINGPERING